jgi:hypothetical protein
VLADPALPDLLHRRLRDGPLPAPHAPTASGWSNFSRVGFFLLLDQDALSRRTVPSIYSVPLCDLPLLCAEKDAVFYVWLLFARTSRTGTQRKSAALIVSV